MVDTSAYIWSLKQAYETTDGGGDKRVLEGRNIGATGTLSVVRTPWLHVSSDIHLEGKIKSEAWTSTMLSTNLGQAVIGYGTRAMAIDVLLAQLWVNHLVTWPHVRIRVSKHVVAFLLVNRKIGSSCACNETLLIISPLLRLWLSPVIVLPEGEVIQTSGCLY